MTSERYHREHQQVLSEWYASADVHVARALSVPDEWLNEAQIFAGCPGPATCWPEYAAALARLAVSGHVVELGGRYKLERPLRPPSLADTRMAKPHHPGVDGECRDGWFCWRGTWRRL